MKTDVFKLFIAIIIFYSHVSDGKNKDTLMSTSGGNEDSYSISQGRVRFDGSSSKVYDALQFFPNENAESNLSNSKDGEIKAPVFTKHEFPEDINQEFEDFGNDKNVFTNSDNIYDTQHVRDDTGNKRIVFVDDGNRTNRELYKKSKRKPKRRQNNDQSTSFHYNSHQNHEYDSQNLTPTDIDSTNTLFHSTGLNSISHLKHDFYTKSSNPTRNSRYGVTTKYSGSNTGNRQSLRMPQGDYSQDYANAGSYPYTAVPAAGGYGYPTDPNGLRGQYSLYPGFHRYPGPTREPQSLTQKAVSAVTEALTSIALFDDKQCVPRILCEVASGRVKGSSTMLKAAAGIGPLLGMLQSYNGLSASPLFIFGRAAVLGLTSVSNTIACHRAYPLCPNDPTELINYLNNHNGGFFRFFGQPQQKPQNLEQFYNHLSGQSNQLTQEQSYANKYGYLNQILYPKNTISDDYDENDTTSNSKVLDIDTSESEIQERIINKPGIDIINEEEPSNWSFPDEASNTNGERKRRRLRKQKYINPTTDRALREERDGNPLKFPKDTRSNLEEFDKEKYYTQKVISFPVNKLEYGTNYQTNAVEHLKDYVYDHKHGFFVRRPKQVYNIRNKDEAELVYIVRGNGDPNHPEILRVKSGQYV